MTACFPLLNSQYFDNLVLSVNAAQTEAELQALVNTVYADLSLIESTITSQLAFLAPINALLTVPGANFGDIITWITGVIGVLTQMYAPFITMTAQLAALPADIASLSAAIASAAASKGFTITIPSVSVVCEL